MSFLTPKTSIFILILLMLALLLIALVDTVVLLERNQFPGVDIGKYTGYFSPYPTQYRLPTLNPDNTITYHPSLSKLEKVEERNFLFQKYTLLTIRPKMGENKYRDQTYILMLPSNLQSKGKYTVYPPQLKNQIGKEIYLTLTFKSDKAKFTYADLSSWEDIQ